MIIERMAREVGLPVTFVHNLSRAASHEYKTYKIAKRGGGFRVIHHPSRRLKALQRWLLANVIDGLPIHPAATAYRRGLSILHNANAHVASRYLLRMDILEFFPSITFADVTKYISDRSALFSGWTQVDIDVFCKLVCRNSVLTIGAPTSPGLSNAVCYDMDVLLNTLGTKSNVTYTRYADDLFFSTKDRDVLRQIEQDVEHAISTLALPAGLKINATKTRHSSKRRQRRVTGIVLGSDGHSHVGRRLKRKIRALIHRYDALSDEARATLRGMIAYATGLDPHFKNSLIGKFGLPAVRRATAPATSTK